MFFIFAFNFTHVVAIVLILSTDQGDLTQGVCLLAKFRPVFSITNFKKPNKHTPSVQSACTTTKTTVVEQKEYNISSQILEGNRKITNDEFLSLCELARNHNFRTTCNKNMIFTYQIKLYCAFVTPFPPILKN